MNKLLAAMVAFDTERAFTVMICAIDAQIEALRKSLGVRPDVGRAEEAVQATARSIDACIASINDIEALLCRPTPPYVGEAIRRRVEVLKGLHREVVLCRQATAKGDAKTRDHATEN